jgi:hypothetical protein
MSRTRIFSSIRRPKEVAVKPPSGKSENQLEDRRGEPEMPRPAILPLCVGKKIGCSKPSRPQVLVFLFSSAFTGELVFRR